LILLAFLLPLAVYLLALGIVNRRRGPLLVSGVWDAAGLLFALSGFLCFGGPAALTGLEERWRVYWLLGRGPAPADGWSPGLILSAAYFVVVVAAAGLLLAGRRRLTAVYNADPDAVAVALEEACAELGLGPVRSGNRLLLRPDAGSSRRPEPGPLRPDGAEGLSVEIDPFPAMNHVTLRWHPAAAPVRREVEAALARRLDGYPAPDSDLGGWLLLAGTTLLGFTTVAGLGLVAVRLWAG
jgi:hypothetical protein